MKKKKTIIAFLILISALYATWNTVGNISQEFGIPIPIILFFILILYVVWKDGEVEV